MVLLQRNYTYLRIHRGSNIFQGVQLFPGGVQMLISIEIHITCDFQGGGVQTQTPYPPSVSAHESSQ